MRIVVYSWKFYPSIGGTEVTTRTLARVLVEAGHSVSVVTGSPLGAASELDEGYEIVRSSSKWQSLSYILRQADLVISKGGVSVIAGLAAILTRRRLIVVHEMAGPYRQSRGGVTGFLANWLREVTCRYASCHVAVTEACLDSKGLPADASRAVIYNAVDRDLETEARESVSADGDIITLLYVGRVIAAKGVFVLEAALERFEVDGSELSVAVVGVGDDEQALRERVGGWRHVRVTFMGALRGEELARAYRNSRVIVFPSSTHPEGMGLVIAEAFAFGKPVVASDQPAVKEVLDDAGLTFRVGDPADLYLKIQRLLTDHQFYVELSNRARRHAHEFSEVRYKASWQRLLSSLEGSERA